MIESIDKNKLWGSQKYLKLGYATLAVLVFGLGGWMVFASIAGAVVSFGKLQVEAQQQVVQHPDGGVVKDIFAKDGDIVQEGDVILKFDPALLEVEQNILANQILDAELRVARLVAERDDLGEIPAVDLSRHGIEATDSFNKNLEVQQKLFEARLSTERSKISQLKIRQSQLEKDIEGTTAQKNATITQLGIIEKELAEQRELYEKGYARITKIYELERNQSGLNGRIGEFDSQIAESLGRISEIEIEMLRLKSSRQEEAVAGLREIQPQIQDLQERYIATTRKLDRLEVRAPRTGTVLEMAVNTPNSVVRPADPILYVVPSDSKLLVEARVDPSKIDDIFPGQPANLRFTAFNARTTPEIEGSVSHVSADAIEDKTTGSSYYLLKVNIAEDQLALLDEQVLVPGMPVDLFLKTGEHSPMTYLMKPFTDYFSRSLRE